MVEHQQNVNTFKSVKFRSTTLKLTCVSVSSGPSTSMRGVTWSRLITWMVAPPTHSPPSARFWPNPDSDGFRALARVSKALKTHTQYRSNYTHIHTDRHIQTEPLHAYRVISLADCSSCWSSEVSLLFRDSLRESVRLAREVTTLARVPKSPCPDSDCRGGYIQ
jgi:hypothetical protein